MLHTPWNYLLLHQGVNEVNEKSHKAIGTDPEGHTEERDDSELLGAPGILLLNPHTVCIALLRQLFPFLQKTVDHPKMNLAASSHPCFAHSHTS